MSLAQETNLAHEQPTDTEGATHMSNREHLPDDLHALALQAICTPLVDAFAALNVLSDEIQTRELSPPWLGLGAHTYRDPLEEAWEWASWEWLPKMLEVEGSHEIEVLRCEEFLGRYKRGIVCTYRRIKTGRVHTYFAGQLEDDLVRKISTHETHDVRALHLEMAQAFRYVEIRKYTTRTGKTVHLHTWHRSAPNVQAISRETGRPVY